MSIEDVPGARASDPSTSWAAVAVINEDGSRRTQGQIVLSIVRRHPGLTTGEISERFFDGSMRSSKRLADLKNLGLVKHGVPREFKGSGRKQVTWWPVAIDMQMDWISP